MARISVRFEKRKTTWMQQYHFSQKTLSAFWKYESVRKLMMQRVVERDQGKKNFCDILTTTKNTTTKLYIEIEFASLWSQSKFDKIQKFWKLQYMTENKTSNRFTHIYQDTYLPQKY